MILVLSFIIAILCWAASNWFFVFAVNTSMRKVPTVAGFTRFSPLAAVAWFFSNVYANLREGYSISKSSIGLFKTPFFGHWVVLVTSKDRIDEVAAEHEGRISSQAATDKLLSMSTILSPIVSQDPYHITIAISHLRVTDELVKKLSQDIAAECDRLLPADHNECIAMQLAGEIIVGMNNTLLLGTTHYKGINLSMRIHPFLQQFLFFGPLAAFLPTALGKFLVNHVFRARTKLLQTLRDIVVERKDHIGLNDVMIQDGYTPVVDRLVRAGEKRGTSIDDITAQLAQLQLASSQSTIAALLHILYWLATNMQWQNELYDEVSSVTNELGWTRAALMQMPKMDSFIKETLRVHSLGAVSLNRLVVRPFKFKDGIELPVGTQIFAPTTCIHGDNDLWVSADTFQPFRFCSASEQNPRGIPDTSPEFLTFGHGRHACPGRYLAACQLKIILAHLLTRFVIEFKAANKRPKDKWVGGFCFPETATILVFRRRA